MSSSKIKTVAYLSLIVSILALFVSFTSLYLLTLFYHHIQQNSNTVPVIVTINGSQTMYLPQITVPIVAVTTDGEGVLGYLHIKTMPGHGNILLEANPFSEIDLQYSLNKALSVARMVTQKYTVPYDFVFSYDVGDAQVIGGESAGAAACLGIIAILENRSIKEKVAITGTIELDGSIGKVGGVFEKAQAAAEAGYKVFLVPKGQSILIYYEKKVIKREIMPGYYIYSTRYVPQTLDLKEYAKQEWGMEIIEVSNIYEAMNYMLE
ncbi:MAG: hypothetical protein GXN99_03230 [Candidatus Nanohaloarchaeota archaeon]|nr:hypothetical protein [Candidatus Nanohaloarchaeota archaeon]